MNFQNFKQYAKDNIEQAIREINYKAHMQRVNNKVNAFDQKMEKNIKDLVSRIEKNINSLTESDYKERKNGLLSVLTAESIKSQCHSEVYKKSYSRA